MSICGWKAEFSVVSRSQNKEKIAAVLLENTFTSIPDIARLLFPFRHVVPLWFIPAVNNSHSFRIIKWLPVWFYKNQFKSGRKSCRITQPTLFLSGLSDQVCCNFKKKTHLIGRKPHFIGSKTHFIGRKTHLIGRKTHLIWRKKLFPLQLIPPKMMTDLYTTCGAPVKRLARSVGKQFHIIWCIIADLRSNIWDISKLLDRFPAGSHNETWACSDYYQTITYFLDEVERRTKKNKTMADPTNCTSGALLEPGKWTS